MRNFSIAVQIKKELDDFFSGKVQLAAPRESQSVRFARNKKKGYWYNQHELVTLIDLYYNSKFENGDTDNLNQKKLFLNTGKFRTEVSAKQIDLDLKNFRFTPDDYADPYTAMLMQKEFRDWAKDAHFSEDINTYVENFPKYGTIVAKKVGNDIVPVPLQTLRNEQTADSLQEASYVIEEHHDMEEYEIREAEKEMGWDLTNLTLKYGDKLTVYERYGYVPLGWLKKVNNDPSLTDADWDVSVDAMVIVALKANMTAANKEGVHIFYAEQVADDERPYREAHYDKQHGRWLGVGEMENQLPSQVAKNVIINLLRRSLHWSSKRIFKTTTAELAAKNLVRDVKDGEILEVGANGDISQVDLTLRAGADFTLFLNEFERHSDQISFTYEANLANVHSATAFRLGALLTQAAQAYFDLKREKLGLFFKRIILDFKVPQFIKEIDSTDRLLSVMSDEPGYEILKAAGMSYIRSEAARITLLSGKPVDGNVLAQAVQPYDAIRQMFFQMAKNGYKDVKYKFDLDPTDESTNVEKRLQALQTLYQALAARQDPRADKVLARIAALSGESLESFGAAAEQTVPAKPTQTMPPGAGSDAAPTGTQIRKQAPGSASLRTGGGPVMMGANG